MASGPETLLVNRMRVAIKREHPSAWVIKVHDKEVKQWLQ